MAETKYHILTLNQISSQGLHRLPGSRYTVGKNVDHPDAILVRSHNMLDMAIPPSVKAIGRAGAGTNNIPVAEMSQRGVPVFNAPFSNTRSVAELVIGEIVMLLRRIVPRSVSAHAGVHGARKRRAAASRRMGVPRDGTP